MRIQASNRCKVGFQAWPSKQPLVIEPDPSGRARQAEYVTEMARRIAALILMQPDLDANYEAIKADTWPWPRQEPGAK